MTLLVTECKRVGVLLYIFTAIYIAIDYIEEIYSTHSKGHSIMGKKDLILLSWSKIFISGIIPVTPV